MEHRKISLGVNILTEIGGKIRYSHLGKQHSSACLTYIARAPKVEPRQKSPAITVREVAANVRAVKLWQVAAQFRSDLRTCFSTCAHQVIT